MTSLFHNVTVSPLDGRSHQWNDHCNPDSPSHAAFAKEVSDQQLTYLQSLPLFQRNQALGVAGLDATQRAKTILLNQGIEHPGLLLTSPDIKLAVEDVLEHIRDGSHNDTYFIAVVEGVIDRTKENARTKGEGVQGGAEQLLSIAARMAKGEKCECVECGPAVSRRPTSVHDFVMMGLEELEEVAKELNLIWKLSERGRFCLHKLSTIEEAVYTPVKHLANYPGPQNYHQLEEMWCLENSECDCWEVEEGASHNMFCELSDL